jgi:hypothetical protein
MTLTQRWSRRLHGVMFVRLRRSHLCCSMLRVAPPRAAADLDLVRRLVCSSCVPAPNTLRATSLRSSVGGLPTTSAVSRPRAKSFPAFMPMQRRFSLAWKTAKLRVLPSLFQTVRRPSDSRASGAGSGTANSAAASGCGGSQVLRRYRLIVWAYRLCGRAVEAAPRVCKVSATAHTS